MGVKMADSFYIFGKEIPIYGALFFGGIGLAGLVAALLRWKKPHMEAFDLVCSAVYSMIGAMIGSKLLFIAVTLDDIIKYNVPLEAVIKGGFVFYGGLIGGFLGLVIYMWQFKMHLRDFVDTYAAVVPLGHALGRVGCFFAGCCWGFEYDGPGAVIYTDVMGNTPVGVPLFPVQLLEAALLLVLFAVLVVVFFKSQKKGTVAFVYAGAYSVIRFVVEFFRADRGRGLLLGISTSQWISILVLACAVLLLVRSKRAPKPEQ